MIVEVKCKMCTRRVLCDLSKCGRRRQFCEDCVTERAKIYNNTQRPKRLSDNGAQKRYQATEKYRAALRRNRQKETTKQRLREWWKSYRKIIKVDLQRRAALYALESSVPNHRKDRDEWLRKVREKDPERFSRVVCKLQLKAMTKYAQRGNNPEVLRLLLEELQPLMTL